MPVSLTGKSFDAVNTRSFNIYAELDKQISLTVGKPAARLNFFETLITTHQIDPRFVILLAIRVNDPKSAVGLINFVEKHGVVIPLEKPCGDATEDADTNFFAFVASHGYIEVTERLFKHGLDKCALRNQARDAFVRDVLEARCLGNKTLPEYLMSIVSPYTLINEGFFDTLDDKEPLLNFFKLELNRNDAEIEANNKSQPTVTVAYGGISSTLDFVFSKMVEFDIELNKKSSVYSQKNLLDTLKEFYFGRSEQIKDGFTGWMSFHHIRSENDVKLTGETRRTDKGHHIEYYHFDLELSSILRDSKRVRVRLSIDPLCIAKNFKRATDKQDALRAEKHGDHKALQVANSALSTAVVATEAVKEVQIEVKEVKTEVKQVKAEVQVLSKKVKAIEIRVNNLEAALKEIRKFARAQCQQSDVAIIDELKDRDLISFYSSVRDAINDALRNTLDGVLQQTKFLLAAQTTAAVLELGSNTVGAPGLGAAGKLILFAAYHISVLEAKNKAKALKEVLSAYDAPKLIAIDVAETLAMQLRKDPEALAKFKANKDRVIAAVVRVVVKKQLGSELKHLVKELGEMAADNQSQLLTGFSSYLKLTAVEENPHTRQSHTYKFKHPQSSAFKGIHGLFKPEKNMLSFLDSNGSAGSSDLSSSGTPENKSQLTSNLRVTPFIAI